MFKWFKRNRIPVKTQPVETRPSCDDIFKMAMFILNEHPHTSKDTFTRTRMSLKTGGVRFNYWGKFVSMPEVLVISVKRRIVFDYRYGRCERYNYGQWVDKLQSLYHDVQDGCTEAQVKAFRDL